MQYNELKSWILINTVMAKYYNKTFYNCCFLNFFNGYLEKGSRLIQKKLLGGRRKFISKENMGVLQYLKGVCTENGEESASK